MTESSGDLIPKALLAALPNLHADRGCVVGWSLNFDLVDLKYLTLQEVAGFRYDVTAVNVHVNCLKNIDLHHAEHSTQHLI
jgi:hypothetical protein